MKIKSKYADKIKKWAELMQTNISASDIAREGNLTRNQIIGAVWRYKTGRSR